jgi:hypothetical protein
MVVPGSFWVYAFGRRQQIGIALVELATPPPGACGGRTAGGFTVRVFPAAEICSTPGPSSATPPSTGRVARATRAARW